MNQDLNSSEKKKLKTAQIGMTLSIISVFLPCIFTMIYPVSDSSAKWCAILTITLVLPTLYFSWEILKIAYKDLKNVPNPPLWVPKIYGFGLSVNPYNRFGKLIMLTFALVIIGLDIYIALTPASLINH